jgi:IS5 family transposase
MRQERIIQASLFVIFATHEIGRELQQISQWLDQHRPLLRLVSNDLRRDGCARPAGVACRRKPYCAARC